MIEINTPRPINLLDTGRAGPMCAANETDVALTTGAEQAFSVFFATFGALGVGEVDVLRGPVNLADDGDPVSFDIARGRAGGIDAEPGTVKVVLDDCMYVKKFSGVVFRLETFSAATRDIRKLMGS
jgi:hypothetical protein